MNMFIYKCVSVIYYEALEKQIHTLGFLSYFRIQHITQMLASICSQMDG